MDILTMKQFKSLAEIKSDQAISIYLPTHRFGKKTEQDPIRFKNLLNEAEKRLLNQGLRKPVVDSLLRPALDMLPNAGFWKYNSDGLAVFITADFFKVYRLPITFEELIVTSSQFHLKPLLPFFARDGHFYVLSLSQKQCKLYEGTKHTIDEIEFEETLPDFAEAMKYDQFSKELQFHTSIATTSGGENAAMFHGHDPSDDDKKRLLQWFQKVDQTISTLLADENSPMVLAGVEYLIPIYKEASSYANIVENSIKGNPEELRPEEIHKKAWPILMPRFSQEEKDAKERYFELKNKGQTSQSIDEALFAAHHGKIETLFIAIGEQVWGDYDIEKQTLEIHTSNLSGDYDLLDVAAIQTIQNGGNVFMVDAENIPDHNHLAAIFRY